MKKLNQLCASFSEWIASKFDGLDAVMWESLKGVRHFWPWNEPYNK